MKKRIQYAFILILTFCSVFSQEKFTLSGSLTNNFTKAPVSGATIFIEESKSVLTANEDGAYSISLPKGEYTVHYTYVGYKKIKHYITLNKNTIKNISFDNNDLLLSEVIVTNPLKNNDIQSPAMSVNKIPASLLRKLPAILGETDIIKAILTLPGVSNAGEGQSGFNVRGGAADQNLILLDGATIFNSSHLFGFFSVFNADAIEDIKLYKGGIPANFGGRAASVLDINQKTGDISNFHMNGGIGIISSRLLAEGPIAKDKGSFLISGRGSYAHLFLKLSDNKNSAYFYDLNAKLYYKLNDHNNLYLTGYYVKDLFRLSKSFINTYGNSLMNLKWNHSFNKQFSSNLSLIYSSYFYNLDFDLLGFKWDSDIKNYNLKYDFKHNYSSTTKLAYGLNSIYYKFNPGVINPSNESSSFNSYQLDQKNALENSFYIDIEHKLSKKIAVNYGLRHSSFLRLGPQEVNVYENNQAVVYDKDLKIYEKASPIGALKYSQNQTFTSFNNLEPRFSIAFTINENQALKASYNRMAQYLHLISNTQSPTPLDIWAPSDDFLKPQILDQYVIGYQKDINNGALFIEVESFYKKVKNRLDYIDGADLLANNSIEQVVLPGKSRAYGLELLVKKNKGSLRGWISYTLSRSEQKTEGRTPTEIGINRGNWYKTGWDKLHNLSLTGIYVFNKKWSYGSIFTLQTGQPVSYPTGQYNYQGISIPSYSDRNTYNLPSYHRLDISATLTPKSNQYRKFKTEWVFGIYNVYNRKNAASINFQQNVDSGNNEAVRLSIFGIIPSISYNFKF